ncbi:fem-1-like C protein [Penaeus vannamei]|uniref:Fem-1-like C protein n=1 Tax=Penaeus vannamei TaxID=6689 RepID=A0A423SVN7_PENVA|nr:fem-1-like C protein [Penaeus vannamei]
MPDDTRDLRRDSRLPLRGSDCHVSLSSVTWPHTRGGAVEGDSRGRHRRGAQVAANDSDEVTYIKAKDQNMPLLVTLRRWHVGFGVDRCAWEDLTFLCLLPVFGSITASMLLDHRSRSEVARMVSARTNGATPLVMASKNGHLSCVEYLVERCNADLEQVGSVVFDGETIDGAPPLWCAAAAGHLDVVSYLLGKAANVNATTKTNSTPLRAACFDGHFDIVKYLVEHNADIEVANRHGHTCLMIACYKGHFDIAKYLIDIAANVNRKSVKGNTALHDCAESGSLEIMKLLLDHCAKMDVDSYGMTPLLAASVTGHTHIVEYLISRSDLVSRKDKIDALELLGATYVDKKRDMLGALRFWKMAMSERYEYDLMIYPKPVQQSPIAAYENSVEVMTMQQLDEIISDPDEMRMQALLVRERILGPAHPDTSYYIRYRGPGLTALQRHTMRKAVYHLVRMDPRGTGGVTPLHLACSRDSSATVGRFPICTFPSLEVVSLLLEVGADPCATDQQGNTPLHTLASNKQCRRELLTSLLAAGAHLDTLNGSGQSFASLRASRGQRLSQLINPLHYTSLQCLAAATIRRHGLHYRLQAS